MIPLNAIAPRLYGESRPVRPETPESPRETPMLPLHAESAKEEIQNLTKKYEVRIDEQLASKQKELEKV